MNYKLILATAAFLAASPPVLHAQAAPPAAAPPAAAPTASAVTLRFQFKPGMSRSYKAVIDMDGTVLIGQSGAGTPFSQHMEMTLRQTVQSVRPSDGAATIVTGLQAMTIRMNGEDKALPQSKLDQMQAMTTSVVTPVGKMLSTVLDPALSNLVGGMAAGSGFNPTGLIETLFALPIGPVSVGDTWHSTEDAAAAAVAPTSTYSLKSLDLSAGGSTAHITRKLDGNLNTVTLKKPTPMKVMSRVSGTGETVFDTKQGTVESQTVTGSSIITIVGKNPQTGAPLSYKMQLQTKEDVEQLFTATVTNPAAMPPVQ